MVTAVTWRAGRAVASPSSFPSVVGTVLSAVNQGDVLLSGDAGAGRVTRSG